jgi:hypothetical protein
MVGSGAASYNADWGRPVYFAKSTDPMYTIHCTEPWGTCGTEGASVHIPSYALPENTSDAHMVIVDGGTEYDFWGSAKPSGSGGSLTIAWGGKGNVNGNGYGMGSTAAGFAGSMGLVRPEELIARNISHALFLITPCENGHVAPATADDGPGAGVSGCPPLGSHIWLSSTPAQIAASGASPAMQTIMLALHTYGGYLGDRCTSCSLELSPVSALTFTQPGYQDLWAYVGGPTSAGIDRLSTSTGSIDLQSALVIIQ